MDKSVLEKEYDQIPDKPDVIQRILMEPGNVEYLTDIDDLELIPLQNLQSFAWDLRRANPKAGTRILEWIEGYLRKRISLNRQGRKEGERMVVAKEQRTQERIVSQNGGNIR